MQVQARFVLALVMTATLAGCAGAASESGPPIPSVAVAATPTPGPTQSIAQSAKPASSPSMSAPPACPNADGGVCVGPLQPGTYTTRSFQPTLTYTVPASWDNEEDLAGNFLLIPPGGSFAGVNPGTSDYLGAYTSVAADAPDCADHPAAGVGFDPSSIAAWLGRQPDLHSTVPKPVSIGGLSGLTIDLTLKPPATDCAGVMLGQSPSDFEHGVIAGLTMRLYLLAYKRGTLAIELDDLTGGKHLPAYSDVVGTFQFAGQ
jgi:hypothetical protein